jgi:hypothetical protein
MHPAKFLGYAELHEYAERNGLAYSLQATKAFAKRRPLARVSPAQYELVEVQTDRGTTKALLFSKATLRAEKDSVRFRERKAERERRAAAERPKKGRRNL